MTVIVKQLLKCMTGMETEVIITITGTTALCEPWPSSELFTILPYWISKQLNS
jgi:hypothetical protein